MRESPAIEVPFPYYGGKRKLAGAIWARLGNPSSYLEFFAGSLACLLARPGGAGPREVVTDTDGGICNFHRAVRADPAQVAHWANYPTVHQDLTARHCWLRAWFDAHPAAFTDDPDFYDAQVAGWWVWGISLWIGSKWCHASPANTDEQVPLVDHSCGGQGVSAQRNAYDKTPHLAAPLGGRGVNAQRRALDQVPVVLPTPGGQGVSAQRTTHDKRPHVDSSTGGQGVSAQRKALDQVPRVSDIPAGNGVSAQRKPGDPGTRAAREGALVEWFERLADRLHGVVVLDRDWKSLTSPTMLGDTKAHPRGDVGILIDPPYLTGDRSKLYASDDRSDPDLAARESYAWAVERGERHRIAYCCHAGDFPIPSGWTSTDGKLQGIRRADRRSKRDLVMFSPACVSPGGQIGMDFDA